VTQTDNVSANHSDSFVTRLAWIALVLASLYICYFHNLGAIGLVGPDEPRYAWIARDMAETGDWVTPKLYGKPWFEKPPLLYWGAALSFKLFGVSDAAARFPSAVAAVLATLAMAWLAWRIYGAETARWLLLLLPTTVGMIGFSHAAATDMPFAAMLAVAMVFAARLLGPVPSSSSTSFTSSNSFTSFCFGLFLGLAALAKGPAAVVLSAGAVLLWAVLTKRWREAFRCLHPMAIAAFCLTALPWYILCAHRNPDFFRVFIIEHNFKRYLTPEFQHIQPFWFYIPILLLALFPWLVFLLPAFQRLFSREQRNSSEWSSILFLACWAFFPLLFFSISKSKLPGYILPSLPPLALMLAPSITKQSHSKPSPRWPLLGTGAALVLFGIALHQQARKFPVMFCTSPDCGFSRIWLIAAIGGIVVAVLALLRSARLSLFSLICSTLLLVVGIDRFLPNLEPGISARDATQVVRHVWPDFSPQGAATWQLNRPFSYQLNFYFHEELPEWNPGEKTSAWVFVAKNRVQNARTLGLECVRFVIDPAVVPCRQSASVTGFSTLDRLGRSSESGLNRQSR